MKLLIAIPALNEEDGNCRHHERSLEARRTSLNILPVDGR